MTPAWRVYSLIWAHEINRDTVVQRNRQMTHTELTVQGNVTVGGLSKDGAGLGLASGVLSARTSHRGFRGH